MSICTTPSPRSSGSDFPSMKTSTAFSISSSSPSSPSSSMFSASCPLQTESCKKKCGTEVSNLVDHLMSEHRAKHFDVLFDENGLADIRFETLVPCNETIARKTAILLSLPAGEVMCWSMETKRRADGELQASSSLQIVERPAPSTPHALSPNEEEEEGELLLSSKSGHHHGFSNTNWEDALNINNNENNSKHHHHHHHSKRSRAAPSSPSSSSLDSAQESNDFKSHNNNSNDCNEADVEVIYNTTIIAGDDDTSSLQWNGVLSSSRPSLPHEYLVSHGGALVALYPTNKGIFIEKNHALCIPINLRLQAISKFKRESHHHISSFLPPPPLLINEK